MTDIISSTSLSFDAILADLTKYVQSLPDYNTSWKDFYEGGAGKTVLDVGSAISSYLALLSYLNRRDSILDFSTLKTTVVGIAAALGYIYNRQSAPLIQIQVTVDTDTVWDKLNPIGTYGDYELSLLETTTLPKGTSTITVAIGSWVAYTYTSASAAEFQKILVEGSVDNNHYSLTVDGNSVNLVTAVEDLDATNAIIRSYTTGVFIIFGNGTLGKQLTTNDEVVFEYIDPSAKLTSLSLETTDVSLYVGSVASVSVLSQGSNSDTSDKIVALAPGYYSTKRRLVTLGDYKYLGGAFEGLTSAMAEKTPGSCCSVDVAYVREDEAKLTEYQRNQFQSYLDGYSLVGVTNNIIDSTPINVDVSLVCVVAKTADTVSITDSIKSYLQKMCLISGGLFAVSGLQSIAVTGLIRLYYVAPIVDRQADFDQYFRLNTLNITYTTDTNSIISNGTDKAAGYS